MAGTIVVSDIRSDNDNTITFTSNTGETIFTANLSSGIDGNFLANTGVTAAVYGGASQIPVVTVDEKGRITSAANVGVSIPSFDSPLNIVADDTGGAEIRLPEDTDNGVNFVALKANSSIASNVTFVLPNADGTSNQVLRTDGSGNLSFITVGSVGSANISAGDSKVEVTDTGSDGTIKFFTDNVEKMKILPAGRLVLFGDSTTGGPYIGADGSGTSIITVAAGATVTLTSSDCGAVLVCVYDGQTGRGGVFFGAFTTAVTKLAGDGEATDTGSTFAVFKSVSSGTMTFKNKDSVERPYLFGIYSALAKI